MGKVNYTEWATILAAVASFWLVVSSFVVKMPLTNRFTNRLIGIPLAAFALYTVLETFVLEDVSSLIAWFTIGSALSMLGWGFFVGWPNYTVMLSNGVALAAVVVFTGLNIYMSGNPDTPSSGQPTS